jgi:hypothetical protein
MRLGYNERDGLVVLAMTQADYENVLVALGFATGAAVSSSTRTFLVGLINRLNQGNPNFTPYEVPHADPR